MSFANLRRVVAAGAVFGLALIGPGAASAQEPSDNTQAEAIKALQASVEAQREALAAQAKTLAGMAQALAQLLQKDQSPQDIGQAYRDAMADQSAKCGTEGMKWVAIGGVDGKPAALCIGELVKPKKK